MKLETIKNQYAIEQDYENWYDLYRFHITTSDDRLEYHFNIIIKLIQDELKKKIVNEHYIENSKVSNHILNTENIK